MQRVELEPASLEQVLGERGAAGGRNGLGELHDLIDRVACQIDAGGARDGRDLLDDHPEQPPRGRRVADDADRLARHGGGSADRADQEVFLPERAANGLGELDRDLGARERVTQPLGPLADASVQLAEDDAARGVVPDHAGRLDRREHLRDSAHRPPGAEPGIDLVLVVHAVLEREHGRVGAQDRPETRGGVVRVERFDAEEHGVRPVDALEPLDGPGPYDRVALARRPDGEAGPLDRVQVRAARDEGDLLAGALELRAEVPADPTGPHHHDVHDTYDTLRGSMASLERRVAVDAARAAGQLLKSELSGSRRIAYKGSPTNLVTEMDARVEELIVGRLAAAFPDDAVLAEERGASAGRSGRRWIIDPLDGTTNYAHGFPAFAVSIALESARRVELGVIYDPNLDEMYVAERGRGTTVNDQALAVSTTASLDESLLATGFPYNIREGGDNNLKEYAAFSVRARAVRRMGSAVLYLAWLAGGRLDGYWELRLGPWDVAAGSLMVEEAGGRITNLSGGALELDAPALVATNGRIHSAVLEVLEEVRGGKP